MKHIVLSKEFGERALISSAGSGQYAALIELLNAGVDVHAQGDRALWTAVNTNFFVGAEHLIKAGADVNAGDGQALVAAAMHANEYMIDLLLRAGARVDANNYEAIKAAAFHVAAGKSKSFERLLDAVLKQTGHGQGGVPSSHLQ